MLLIIKPGRERPTEDGFLLPNGHLHTKLLSESVTACGAAGGGAVL